MAEQPGAGPGGRTSICPPGIGGLHQHVLLSVGSLKMDVLGDCGHGVRSGATSTTIGTGEQLPVG